jgi:hypothetical protein
LLLLWGSWQLLQLLAACCQQACTVSKTQGSDTSAG